MDKFNIEMENDNELTDLLWVNYLENRDFREIYAKKNGMNFLMAVLKIILI